MEIEESSSNEEIQRKLRYFSAGELKFIAQSYKLHSGIVKHHKGSLVELLPIVWAGNNNDRITEFNQNLLNQIFNSIHFTIFHSEQIIVAQLHQVNTDLNREFIENPNQSQKNKDYRHRKKQRQDPHPNQDRDRRLSASINLPVQLQKLNNSSGYQLMLMMTPHPGQYQIGQRNDVSCLFPEVAKFKILGSKFDCSNRNSPIILSLERKTFGLSSIVSITGNLTDNTGRFER
ncbi:hypothetical protein HDV02_005139, partial [Globomyces sp. JEL0801]